MLIIAVCALFLFVLVSNFSTDDDSCRLPPFTTYAEIEFTPKNENHDDRHVLDFELTAKTWAELSNVLINVSLPEETNIVKSYGISGGQDSDKNVIVTNGKNITFKHHKSIKEERVIYGIIFKSINNKWSKPI